MEIKLNLINEHLVYKKKFKPLKKFDFFLIILQKIKKI